MIKQYVVNIESVTTTPYMVYAESPGEARESVLEGRGKAGQEGAPQVRVAALRLEDHGNAEV